MRGQNKPIYRAGILRKGPTRVQVYEGGNTSKNTNGAEADHVINGSNCKVGEADSSTNPKKGRTGKRKKNHAGHPSNRPTGAKKCSVHGPSHSTEECKVLKE